MHTNKYHKMFKAYKESYNVLCTYPRDIKWRVLGKNVHQLFCTSKQLLDISWHYFKFFYWNKKVKKKLENNRAWKKNPGLANNCYRKINFNFYKALQVFFSIWMSRKIFVFVAQKYIKCFITMLKGRRHTYDIRLGCKPMIIWKQ